MRVQYVPERPTWAVQVLLALAERGESRRSLAARVGLTPTYLGAILTRADIRPQVETIYKIAKALDLDPLELAKLVAVDTMTAYINMETGVYERTSKRGKPKFRRRPANPDSAIEAAP